MICYQRESDNFLCNGTHVDHKCGNSVTYIQVPGILIFRFYFRVDDVIGMSLVQATDAVIGNLLTINKVLLTLYKDSCSILKHTRTYLKVL